jgi:hypothetical protein
LPLPRTFLPRQHTQISAPLDRNKMLYATRSTHA